MAEEEIKGGDFVYIQLALIMGVVWILAFITRYYPFSEFFRDRHFHAQWIGADRLLDRIVLSCLARGNQFVDRTRDRDENFFYVTGRLRDETDEDIFKDFDELGRKKGFELMYRGKMDDGSYKFMAPVSQDWLKILI